jgi:hypothetical protein
MLLCMAYLWCCLMVRLPLRFLASVIWSSTYMQPATDDKRHSQQTQLQPWLAGVIHTIHTKRQGANTCSTGGPVLDQEPAG